MEIDIEELYPSASKGNESNTVDPRFYEHGF